MDSKYAAASVFDAQNDPPQITGADGARTWITRATNFVIAVTQCREGSVIETEELPDESMLLLPDAGALVEADGAVVEARPNSVVILPPGRARVTARAGGTVVRCCSHLASGLMAQAGNRADFAEPRPEVAPLVPWPAPADGYRLRVYHLPSLAVPGERMRIIRCTNLMVNVVADMLEPRDVGALSPHSHADLEQATLCVRGDFVHHLRTPWGPDMRAWRPDQHIEVGSPSVVVIPAGVIHTSRNSNAGCALLIDVFAPPRADFAQRPEWGRNHDDYPVPPIQP